MIDSSINSRSSFEKVTYRNSRILLDIISNVNSGNFELIRKIYLDRATDFSETYRFLTKIDAIRDASQVISLSPIIRNHDDEPAQHLLDLLCTKESRYRIELYEYLNRFTLRSDTLEYVPSAQSTSGERYIRDFLSETGVIQIIGPHKQTLNEKHYFLHTQAAASRNIFSPKKLELRIKSDLEIGHEAELRAMNYERGRLGQSYSKHIRHVSLENTSAGFDIASVTIESANTVLPRFIEVKSTARKSPSFHWSANEVLIARKLANWYYLYLVFMDSPDDENDQSVSIVHNPYSFFWPNYVLCG